MLLKRDHLDAIACGKVTLVFRRWKRPTVRAGGTLRTAAGVLAIDAVEPISDRDVTEQDARRAGFPSRVALLADLNRGRDGQIYRIKLHVAGADPRIALRNNTKLTAADIAAIRIKLARYDRSSRHGPWTLQVLRLIVDCPGTRAGELAARTGFEKEWLKANIRKLKELGLTESLLPGYRLSPRGVAFLRAAECK